MGSKSSKKVPEWTGDYHYMEQKDRRNIDFCLKWEKRYGFDGHLDVEKLEVLIKQMHKECGWDGGQRTHCSGLSTLDTEGHRTGSRRNPTP